MSKRKFVSLFKSTGFKVIACIALMCTSLLIALAMFLGKDAGTFVIRVQEGSSDKSIAITLDPNDKSKYTRRLDAMGATNFTDNSPKFFLHKDYKELNEITSNIGDYIVETDTADSSIATNRSLYCYTFYIVNTGTTQVNANAVMNYSNVTRDLDDIVRVMSYYVDDINGEVVNIYQKVDKTFKEYTGYDVKSPSYFYDEQRQTAFSENIFIGIGQAVKYSVFFWLEGEDPEHDPSLVDNTKYYGATIQFSLDIRVDMTVDI